MNDLHARNQIAELQESVEALKRQAAIQAKYIHEIFERLEQPNLIHPNSGYWQS